jgi:hypothetical protein
METKRMETKRMVDKEGGDREDGGRRDGGQRGRWIQKEGGGKPMWLAFFIFAERIRNEEPQGCKKK